jgi:hypothetical protein
MADHPATGPGAAFLSTDLKSGLIRVDLLCVFASGQLRGVLGRKAVFTWLKMAPPPLVLSRCYLLFKNMSHKTQMIRASISAPASRTCMAHRPLPYLFSVIDELRAGNHLGNRNQALGERIINRALMNTPTPRTAAINQPRMYRISDPAIPYTNTITMLHGYGMRVPTDGPTTGGLHLGMFAFSGGLQRE